MMRLKLVGANRASFKGAPKTIMFGGEVDVDDNVGLHLLEQKAHSKSMGERPLWQLVRDTGGDSAATLDEAEVEVDEEDEDPNEGLDLEEEEEEEEVPPPPPVVKKKVVAKKKVAAKKARTRKPTA